MKISRKCILGMLLIFVTFNCYSQIDSSKVPLSNTPIEKGKGEGSWAKFLKKNLNQDVATWNGAPNGEYTVIIEFTIFEDGQLGEFNSITNHGYGMEKELIRVLKKSPKWSPAFQDGKFVKSKKRQSITFFVDNY